MKQYQINPQLFKLSKIEQPFEDLSHVQPFKAEDANYGIDLYLFLNMITYIPNASFDLEGKNDQSKKIKKILVTIHKEFPSIENGEIIFRAIELKFRVIPRTATQDSKLQSNPDRVMLSGYSRYLVVPEKCTLNNSESFLEKRTIQDLDNYLLYASKIITNSEYYPYFGYMEKEEGKNKFKILKLIYKQETMFWRE